MENKSPAPLDKAQGKPEEQQLELLKREDVRTLAKDLAQTRNQESLHERARIGNLPEAELRAKEVVPERSSTSEPKSVAPTPEVPPVFSMPESASAKKPRFGKLFIRVALVLVVLFFVLNIVALAFFLLSQKEGPEESVSQEENSQSIPEPLRIPLSAFPIQQEEQIQLETSANLAQTLSTLFQAERETGFSRIVLLLSQENRVWTAQEFFAGLALSLPSSISSALENSLTLFAYKNPKDSRTRIGFAVPLKEGAGIQENLLAWESSMEQSFAAFFSFQGKKDSAAVSFFRETAYKGVRIRYQTYSREDLGLVYALHKNTLVVTSGLESMKAVLDAI